MIIHIVGDGISQFLQYFIVKILYAKTVLISMGFGFGRAGRVLFQPIVSNFRHFININTGFIQFNSHTPIVSNQKLCMAMYSGAYFCLISQQRCGKLDRHKHESL